MFEVPPSPCSGAACQLSVEANLGGGIALAVRNEIRAGRVGVRIPEPVVSVTPPARKVKPNGSRFASGIWVRYLLPTSVPRVASSASSSTGTALTVIFDATARVGASH